MTAQQGCNAFQLLTSMTQQNRAVMHSSYWHVWHSTTGL